MMRKIQITLFCTVFLLINSIFAYPQENNYRFHKVFFYSFTKYVEWPELYKNNDFIIGVYGTSDITPLLKEMAEIKKVGEHKIVIKTLGANDLNQKINMLFIPDGQIGEFSQIATALKSKPTLIITESPGMAKKGSMVNFKDVDGKLRFEVNTTLVEQSGLKVSKELVRFGEEIR